MALNPFQQAISDLARSLGLRGQQEQQVYQTPQFQQLVTQMFGEIPLPAGVDESMVISRGPTGVEYKDPQGFVHRLERDLNGVSPRLGEVKETSTNRPGVLPLDQSNTPGAPSQQTSQDLTAQLTNIFQTPLALSQLDPATQAMLKQTFDAQNAIQEDQFQKAQATSIAQLVGQGVGASSISGNILNQLLQGQSLARGQQQANQNQTQLGVQQFLTQGQQTQNQSLQQFIEQLLGIGTQRDIASANVGVQQQQVGNQNDQYYRSLQEQMRQFDEQMRLQERQAMIGNIFRGVAAGTGLASGLGGLDFGSLFGKVGSLFGSGGPNNSQNVLGITGG